MTQTNKIIAIVVVAVIISGLAFAFAYWRFKEDARDILAGINTQLGIERATREEFLII